MAGSPANPATGQPPAPAPTVSPWLKLTNTASPNPIYPDHSTTVTASFLKDSAGAAVSVANLVTLIGLPVTWGNAQIGSLSNTQSTIQSSGTATATFTAAHAVGSGSADATVDGATATASITIQPFPTSTSVGSSNNPSTFGDAVTFTATVIWTDGGGTPGGSVQFQDNGVNLGAAQTLTGGVATLTTSALSVGSLPITAVYQGDTNFLASTSSGLSQVVNKADVGTSVVSSINPSVFGQSVTFTASISPVSPGAGTPTGSVTFYDGTTAIDTETLTGGATKVSFTTSSLGVGSHTITASYGGDASFNPSSASTQQSVS